MAAYRTGGSIIIVAGPCEGHGAEPESVIRSSRAVVRLTGALAETPGSLRTACGDEEQVEVKCAGLLGGECLNQCLIVQGVAGLAVGVVLADSRGRIVWLNRTAEVLLGTTLAECSQRPMAQVLKSPELQAFWHDAVKKDENYFAEVTVQWPRPLELKLSATRCLDDSGKEIGRALLVCDVTQERTVQVRLSQAVATRLLALTSGHMPPEPVASLTQQELKILRMVGKGLGNTEIAALSHVSASTVRSHLKNLYKKLNLSSRAEAVSFAVRHHLV